MMTKRDFLKNNRQDIDRLVSTAYGCKPSNDIERWEWVMNDEGLYNWARSEGVKV